jgi:hypothetical protein
MLSQKLLVDVGDGMFTGENHHQQHKSATKSACTASFHPWPSSQVQAIIQKLFHLKNEAPTGAGGRADLRETSVLCKAFWGKVAASDTTWTLTAAHCRPHIYTIA